MIVGKHPDIYSFKVKTGNAKIYETYSKLMIKTRMTSLKSFWYLYC